MKRHQRIPAIGASRRLAIQTATALLLAGWVLSPALADDLALLRARAQQGDAHAQVRLGILCRDGKGTPQDYAQALEWFAKAAKTGDAAALDNLGWMHEQGLGTGVDVPAAARYYRASANKHWRRTMKTTLLLRGAVFI